QSILTSMNPETLGSFIYDATYAYLSELEKSLTVQTEEESPKQLKDLVAEAGIANSEGETAEDYKDILVKRSVEVATDALTPSRLMQFLDLLWMTHLD